MQQNHPWMDKIIIITAGPQVIRHHKSKVQRFACLSVLGASWWRNFRSVCNRSFSFFLQRRSLFLQIQGVMQRYFVVPSFFVGWRAMERPNVQKISKSRRQKRSHKCYSYDRDSLPATPFVMPGIVWCGSALTSNSVSFVSC